MTTGRRPLTGRWGQRCGGDTNSKWPASGTSHPLPSVNPQRAKIATRRGSWTDASPVGLAPKFRSMATPQAWRETALPARGVRAVQHPANPAGGGPPRGGERAPPDDRRVDIPRAGALPRRVLLELVPGTAAVGELPEPL